MTVLPMQTRVPMRAQKQFTRADWLVPLLLILFSLVPVIAGGLRLTELITGVEIMGNGERFHADPLPVVLHIISASAYTMLGAFQFSKGIRQAAPGSHRIAGRVLVLAGFVAAGTGIWMVQVYPHAPEGSAFLGPARMVFASATFVALYLGLRAILRHDVTRHRAWMIRAYAIFIGAGTQVFITIPYLILFGEPDRVTGDVLLIGGWLINIAVAEWIIRARPFGKRRMAAA